MAKWPKIAGWSAVVVIALLVFACLAGYLFLKSRSLNQFARRKIGEAVQASTGAATTIGGLDFNLSTLTVHAYNITVHGTEKADQPPLLRIDELTARAQIESVLHRKVNLREIVVRHPLAHVEVTSAGASNLPNPPSSNGSHTNVFDLAVGHAQLVEGELDYNDRRIPLSADLYNFATDVHFDLATTGYAGTISYQSGSLSYGNTTPLRHSFQARFNAAPNQLSVESALLKIGNSSAELRASLHDYANPVIEGDYKVDIDADDAAVLAPAYKPAGNASLAGQVGYRTVANQAPMQGLTVTGRIESRALSAVISRARFSLERLRANYQLAGGSLRVDGIEFDSFGGRVNGELNIRNLGLNASGRVRTSMRNISLQALQRNFRQKLRQQNLDQTAVSGTVNGNVEAAWAGSIDHILVRSDLQLNAQASNASGSEAQAGQVPVSGVIHAGYDGASNTLTLRQSQLRAQATTLAADGTVGRRSSLRVQVNAGDLSQLGMLASTFGASVSTVPPISGSATLNATINGSISKPRIAAQLSAQDLNVQGSRWRSVQAKIQASASEAAITDAVLVSAQRGKAVFSAKAALNEWRYSNTGNISGSLSAEQLSIADLLHTANLQYPLSGDLSANIAFEGSQSNPQATGRIDIRNATAYDESIRTLSAQFRTNNGTIDSSLRVATQAGSAEGNLSVTPASKSYSVRFNAPSIVLEKLHAVKARNLGLTGTLTASASGQGTFDNPQITAQLLLPELSAGGKSISGIKAELQVANHYADVNVNSKIVDSPLQARAHVNLAGDYYADASIETGSLPLEVLLATYSSGVPQGFAGKTEMHATLKGPLTNPAQVEAHVTVPVLNANYQSLQIGLVSPLHADLIHSILTVQPTEIRGTDTDLRIQGSVPLRGDAKPSLKAQGQVDVRIAQIFSPDTKSSGTIAFNVNASGTAQNPSVSGQVRLQDVSALYSGAPLGVEEMNGTLDIGNESVQISHLTGKVGGGEVSAGGSLIYRPSVHFNVALQTKSVRLLYPNGLRTLLDSNLTLSGTAEASTLSGRVLIDSLAFTPDFDLSTFADQFGGTTVPGQPGFADTIKLAVNLQSKENLAANSTQVSVEGNVNVQVIGTAAEPVITGRTNLTAGEVFYRNNRYQLQRGIITFDNPNQTSPVLNVSATTTVEQYNLTLNLRGPFDKLSTSYASDPPLSTADIISLLGNGQTVAEGASQSTDSMVASQATSQVTGGVQKLAGISSLQIDPLIGGSNQNPGARVALQQRVTKNFLFTFSTDVSQPGSEVVQGDYQINKRWSVSTTRDQVGGISVDGRLHTRF